MSQAALNQTQHLEQAFDVFNRMSEQLESSYRNLENQVSVLNAELTAARSERLQLVDRLERLLELLPGGVLVLDENGIIKQVNARAISLLDDHLPGKSWREVTAEHFQQSTSDYSEFTLKSGRHVTLSSQALGNEPGRIILITDVTDQSELKQMLERQDRLMVMGEMTAQLAHQIRTPLSTALLYSSGLARECMDKPQHQRMARKVVERLKQLETMVNDMLLFTRGDNFIDEEIVVAAVLSEFRQIILPQIEAYDGALYLPEVDDSVRVKGNGKAVLGALLNLANNAIQSVGHGIEMTIDITLSSTSLLIVFSDNGEGIDSSISDKIFTPFFTTRSDGTGLGLAVVQATIEAHGGTIHLKPAHDEGATFEIRLPIINDDHAMPSGVENGVVGRIQKSVYAVTQKGVE